MQVSVGKLDSLNIAAGLFHWKGSDKIIASFPANFRCPS